MPHITKLLVANRSEIAIRVFRSATELGIRTVALYTPEDRYALHRFKADEAYQIGVPGEPIRAYLDIDAIVSLAKRHGADAVHPGYGFLSERADFARAVRDAGLLFVGPQTAVLERLGDKVAARRLAAKVGVPVLGGSSAAVPSAEDGAREAATIGYPVILKAAHGGGGRGMRVVSDPSRFVEQFEQARRESLAAFGSPDVFLETYIARAKHIEVQLLGDHHGTLVHLFERDCSVQRRHQKVVEIAPAPRLDAAVRQGILDAAVAIGRAVGYQSAGTVEFLVDQDTGRFYFIEVNPRIQVEHTVTEEVTGIDIVKAQILVAQGTRLDDPRIGVASQESVGVTGVALQCRVTTEDPENQFVPDFGRVSHYRSASGMGIRLDAGTAFTGAVVTPFYDSLLVKVTARDRRLEGAVARMHRSLREFRVRGVRTNIPFLTSLMAHPTFLSGECTTRFIDETPELFAFPPRLDRATKLLTYLGETIVNGNEFVRGHPPAARRDPAPVPRVDARQAIPDGARQRLRALGPRRFAEWLRAERPLLFTDTTFRDAHQSLLATRVRTADLLNIAEAYARTCAGLFSIEMWGGATFDVSLRFLKEDPWERLTRLRERIPNILFQMLLRASNAVGYTNYPDNVVRAFVEEAAAAGIDVFRVFDALNWLPNMRVAMDAVIESGAVCEAAICYSGDLTNPHRTKYDIAYYVRLARELERMGAHILAIKDMAGLCKPRAAAELVRALRQEVGLPIHFHTHDTGGIQAASVIAAAAEGLDVVDAAMAPFSGGTSQPNLNTLVESLRFSDRAPSLDGDRLDAIAEYWRAVREFYAPFDGQVLPASTNLYRHEMPGGQYTNLYQQARALGLADKWPRICDLYAGVNQLFGDIVKVTPTSKAVGDMALFLAANDLDVEDVLDQQRELAFPTSVVDLIGGRMGQPPGGFPQAVKDTILRGRPEVTERPGETLPPADFDAEARVVEGRLRRTPLRREVVTHLLYPKVYDQFVDHDQRYGDTSVLPTPCFFYGLPEGGEVGVEIEPGKTLIIKYLATGTPHPDGTRTVFFELNGQPRDVTVLDHSIDHGGSATPKADAANPWHVGASMPGMVVAVAARPGDMVTKGQKLLALEAMKMESAIHAEVAGTVSEVLVQAGSRVETGDLLVVIGPPGEVEAPTEEDAVEI